MMLSEETEWLWLVAIEPSCTYQSQNNIRGHATKHGVSPDSMTEHIQP